jgi:hypothetical protein
MEAIFRFTKCWLIETNVGTVWLEQHVRKSYKYIFVPFAHMLFVSFTVLRGWWDLIIQPHSPDISLYEPAFCKPEDGLQLGRNMS